MHHTAFHLPSLTVISLLIRYTHLHTGRAVNKGSHLRLKSDDLLLDESDFRSSVPFSQQRSIIRPGQSGPTDMTTALMWNQYYACFLTRLHIAIQQRARAEEDPQADRSVANCCRLVPEDWGKRLWAGGYIFSVLFTQLWSVGTFVLFVAVSYHNGKHSLLRIKLTC